MNSSKATRNNRLHQFAWQVIRWVNSASELPELNDSTGPKPTEQPSQQLFRIARKVKAVGLSEDGRRVDYKALAASDCYQQMRRFTQSLPACTLADLGDRAEQMAFWINLYNVLILDAVIHFQLEGRVPFSLFQKAAYNVCGHRFSADDIEHGVLRANRPHPIYRLRPFSASDPRATAIVDGFDYRIHFALNCAASSCPPIAFYQGEHLEQQLELATANFIQGHGAQLNPEAKRLTLSKIFKWYQADFGGEPGVRKLVSEHLPAEEAVIIRSNQVRIYYADYDWTVNKILR